MKTGPRGSFALLLFPLLLLPWPIRVVMASDPGTVSGSTSLHLEYYDVHGDQSASPYRSEWSQFYNDLFLDYHRRLSPYDFWQGQLAGVFNDSDYRSPDNGLVPERLHLLREKGDGLAPYRLELGNYYGFFSPRTLQRSLIGTQVEMQPLPGGRSSHSLLLVIGANQSSWRHLQPKDNHSQGLSYLLADPVLGRYTFNLVNNVRPGDAAAGSLDRSQQVYSLAGEKRFELGAHAVTAEGELGLFHGDHDGTSDAASGQGRNDSGLFLQAGGIGPAPFSYRLRHEEYGRDYRPEGAAITPDSRATEGHAGWRFASGLNLRGRIQGFRDGRESDNPTDTMTYGLNLSGPLPGVAISGACDLFVKYTDNRDRTIDNRFGAVHLDLNVPLAMEWQGLVGLLFQDLDSRVDGTPDTSTGQVNLSAVRPFALAGWHGSLGPGVVIRAVSEPRSSDLLPTLAVNASLGKHSLDYSLAYSVRDLDAAGAADVETFASNLRYRYMRGPNTLGLELASDHRNPGPGDNTTSTRIGLFWTRSFARPMSWAGPPPEPAMALTVTAGHAGPTLDTLTGLIPGATMVRLREDLTATGLKAPVALPGALVYETRLIGEIDQRQRLVLVEDGGGRLRTSALIIDFADIGGSDDLMRTMERTRGLLIQRFGRPATFIEEGEASGELAAAIAGGSFIRLMEWTRPEGIIRFGIPNRLDGKIRMEIQFARDFPPMWDNRWSIEDVR